MIAQKHHLLLHSSKRERKSNLWEPRDCAIIIGEGVRKPDGGHRGKSRQKKGGLDVMFYTFGGEHYFFHSLS